MAELARSATPALILLAVMARIAFNRAALALARAGSLAEDIIHNAEDSGLHIAMVVRAAHVPAFAAKMVLVADLVMSGPAVIFIVDVHRRMG